MEVIITDQNFEDEVVLAKGKVVVDFWAPWCGPCQVMLPLIEELAKTAPSNVKVGKLNVDENPQTSQRFNIMSIPTIIVFENGKIVNQLSGVQSKETIQSLVK